jgi:hypothetical protein
LLFLPLIPTHIFSNDLRQIISKIELTGNFVNEIFNYKYNREQGGIAMHIADVKILGSKVVFN